MHKAICSSIVFDIEKEKSPSFIINRYKLGKTVNSALYLSPFECLYLYFKKRITPENSYYREPANMLERLMPEEGDFDLYSVYEYLKNKGYYVKREVDCLYYRKSSKLDYEGPVRVRRENAFVTFDELQRNSPSKYATIDDEGDITLFEMTGIEPLGEIRSTFPEAVSLKKIESRYVSSDGRLPDWFGENSRGVRVLTDFEVKYLSDINAHKEIHTLPEDLMVLSRVYSDLVDRNMIVKTGFKYGANFRVYTKSMEEHAEYLVYVLKGKEEWYKISRAVRVAKGVRKIMLFAGIVGEKTFYVSIDRLRDLVDKNGDNKE